MSVHRSRIAPLIAAPLAVALATVSFVESATAGGCGCVPISIPVGEQFKAHTPVHLAFGYGYSFSDTDHYYIGTERDDATETNVAPSTKGQDHTLSVEYDLPKRFTLVGEIPIVSTAQKREFGGVKGTMEASGLGDLRLMARYWVKDSGPRFRMHTALGLRFPTGEADGTFQAQNGTMVDKDVAAQAGTGNTAGLFEFGGSSAISPRLGLSFAGRYLFTPSAEAKSKNFRNQLTGNGPKMNSDNDAATLHLNAAFPLGTGESALRKFALQGNVDFLWIPVDDLIGDSNGFRRAGKLFFAGPGLAWEPVPQLSVSTSVPFALYRDIQKNGGNVQEWSFLFAINFDALPGSY